MSAMPPHRKASARHHLVWGLVVVLAGCGDSPVGPPTAPTPAPATTAVPPGHHTVSGTVFEAAGGGFRPLSASRTIFFWVEQRTDRGSTGWSQPVTTDANGRYSTSVPDSRVSVSAWSRAELQPCLNSAQVLADTTLDVHVIPEREAQSAAADQLRSRGPIVTGQVYEVTGAGPRPLPGADIWVDISLDVYHALTKTDELGRFFLCHIDVPVRIDVDLAGYQGVSRFMRGDSDTYLDIVLSRR